MVLFPLCAALCGRRMASWSLSPEGAVSACRTALCSSPRRGPATLATTPVTCSPKLGTTPSLPVWRSCESFFFFLGWAEAHRLPLQRRTAGLRRHEQWVSPSASAPYFRFQSWPCCLTAATASTTRKHLGRFRTSCLERCCSLFGPAEI